jgi:hypothetical protein
MKFSRCICSLFILLLVACGPSEEHKAQRAEQKRIECLDRYCEGDVEPKRDLNSEVAQKLNGQWFIGPRRYFNGSQRAGFYWPSKTPLHGPEGGGSFPETGKNFYDVAIEIFLRSNPSPPRSPRLYQKLLSSQAEGRFISRSSPRTNLDVWHAYHDPQRRLSYTYYVATDLRDINDEPPVLSCLGLDGSERQAKEAFCTTGWRWRPNISVDLRFSARHASDWPEIYLEVIRVLNLLKKV